MTRQGWRASGRGRVEDAAVSVQSCDKRGRLNGGGVRTWHNAAVTDWQKPFPYRFVPIPWSELLAEYRGLVEEFPGVAPVLAIIETVLDSGLDDQLAAITSLTDLLVTRQPVGEPPVDVICVRGAVSMKPPREGEVVIEHTATSGAVERIERPETEAVPLFWRFVQEKYGVQREVRAQ